MIYITSDKKRKSKKTLKLPKLRFVAYCSIFFSGILLVTLGIFLKIILKYDISYDLLLAAGSSLFTSAITAFFIDKIAQRESEDKRKRMRIHYLWGFPHGICWVAKVVIEESNYFGHIFPNGKEMNLVDALNFAISLYKKYLMRAEDLLRNKNFRTEFLGRCSYGFDLIKRDLDYIIKNDAYLVYEGVFSEEEICQFKYILNDIVPSIEKSFVIAEMGEYLELLFKTGLEIDEIDNDFENKIKFGKNNFISSPNLHI